MREVAVKANFDRTRSVESAYSLPNAPLCKSGTHIVSDHESPDVPDTEHDHDTCEAPDKHPKGEIISLNHTDTPNH